MPPAIIRILIRCAEHHPRGKRLRFTPVRHIPIFCLLHKADSLNWNLSGRQSLSFRASAHTGVGISIEFQAAYRHTNCPFGAVPGILPREVVRLTGRLPHQSADWFAMTGNSIARQIPISQSAYEIPYPDCLNIIIDRKKENGKHFLPGKRQKRAARSESKPLLLTVFTAGSQTASRKCPRCPRPECPFPPAGQKGRICAAAGQSSSGTRSRRN